MNSSPDTAVEAGAAPTEVMTPAVLAREAGVTFKPATQGDAGVDPIAEWLSLMEVVQMLCPVWPVRDQPMVGDHWKL